MNVHARLLWTTTAAAVAVGAAVAPAGGDSGATKITASGVGEVELGSTHKSLRKKKLVRKLRHGCELGGPSTRSARLKAPLEGSVDYTLRNPRRVTNITVTDGATARGVGIGAKIRDIKAEFPKAKVDHSTDRTFLITLVRIPKKGPGDRFQFGVSTQTKRTIVIGIPYIAFCE
jgi:hypothetical protein